MATVNFDCVRKIGPVEDAKAITAATTLNTNQHSIFNIILDLIYRKDHALVLLDAPPGTGKTYTIKTLMLALQKVKISTVFIVYKNDLHEMFGSLTDMHYSNAKYGMLITKIHNLYMYKSVMVGLGSIADGELLIIALLEMVKNMPREAYNIIVDEYTVADPTFLLLLSIMCARDKLLLMLSGDSHQLHSIDRLKHHAVSNKMLFCGSSIVNLSLETSKRCTDPDYNRFLSYIRDNFISKLQEENTPIQMLLFVFNYYPTKFFQESNIHSLFVASYHKQLTNWLHALVRNNPDTVKVSWYRLRVRTYPTAEKPSETLICALPSVAKNVESVSVGKFLPYLPLIIGGLYYYGGRGSTHNKSTLAVYKLISIEDTGVLNMVHVSGNGTKIIAVKRENVGQHFLTKEWYSQLFEQVRISR